MSPQLPAVEEHDADESFTDDGFYEMRDHLCESYRFYVMNPAWTKGVNYSLWVRTADAEYPVLSSNTGGFTTMNSATEAIGDGIEPTETFLDLVGLGAHEAMCFTPRLYFEEEHFERRALSLYDDKPREYEVWAAGELVGYITSTQDDLIPELKPLALWADRHSEFDMPVLADDDEEVSDE